MFNHGEKTDVLIIGGGMAGILCANALKDTGAKCLLVEAETLCSGVTKGTTAKITSQHGLIYHKLIKEFGLAKAEMYLHANEKAIKKYRSMCKSINCDFENKDAYVYSIDKLYKIGKELEALTKLGYPTDFRENLMLPFHVRGAIRFKDQAQFNALKFAKTIATELDVCEHTVVWEINGKTAVTSKGNIEAEHIIVATHFPFINTHGSYFMKMYQHRSYVIALENAPDVDGMYIDGSGNGMSFRNYNDLLLVGGGGHRTGKKGGDWKELEKFAKIYYPDAKEKTRWATQDCMTLDGVPYIGRYSSKTNNLYVATGFNKWGMTSSMIAAELLTDMIQGKANPYEELFSPSRTVMRPQLGINALEATKSILTPTKPRCPHMGCALKKNKTEGTWDCPCHGSRFSKAGELINNPATDDLKSFHK